MLLLDILDPTAGYLQFPDIKKLGIGSRLIKTICIKGVIWDVQWTLPSTSYATYTLRRKQIQKSRPALKLVIIDFQDAFHSHFARFMCWSCYGLSSGRGSSCKLSQLLNERRSWPTSCCRVKETVSVSRSTCEASECHRCSLVCYWHWSSGCESYCCNRSGGCGGALSCAKSYVSFHPVRRIDVDKVQCKWSGSYSYCVCQCKA